MARNEKSVEIKAPPEKVWELLALDRWSEWDVGHFVDTKNMKFTSEVNTPEDKYRVGASAHVVEKRWEYDLDVTESLEKEKITVRSKGKYVYTFTYVLKPVDGGTRLDWVGDFEMPWGILGKALWGIYGRTADRDVERAFGKLKGVLEK